MNNDNPYINQLNKRYVEYLKNLVRGASFVSIILRGGKNKPSSTLELH